MGLAKSTAALLADRWQIPAAFAAVVTTGVALQALKPSPKPLPFDALLADVVALSDAGEYQNVADSSANLLAADPPAPRRIQARLHALLADAVFHLERPSAARSQRNARLVLEHYDEAELLGLTLNPADWLQAGQAAEWLGQLVRARELYERVAAAEDAPSVRRAGLLQLVELLENQPDAAADRQRYLLQLLADPGLAIADLWTGLRETIDEAIAGGDLDVAQALLDHYGGRLLADDLRGYHEFLAAEILLAAQRYDEAALKLTWISHWLDDGPPLDPAVEAAGQLTMLRLWLLGQLELAEQRPQEALEHFSSALAYAPAGPLALQIECARGVALAMLERHPAAQRLLVELFERWQKDGRSATTADLLRRTYRHLATDRSAIGDYENAVRYLEPILALIPPGDDAAQLQLHDDLGVASRAAAQHATDPAIARDYERLSGLNLEAAADLSVLDEARFASYLWAASQAFDRGGAVADNVRVLQRFANSRTDDPRLPAALLRLGQAYEAGGDLKQALYWYEGVILHYPELSEAQRARLLSANCLVALGGDDEARAEQLLLTLLEDANLQPEAAEYRDALLALCDLLYQDGRYSAAVSRLHDFLTLYPAHEQALRARFMLADSYRQSAFALRNTAAAPGAGASILDESRARFRRAAELYGDYLRLARAELAPDENAALFERLALYYRGDCLFELNEPETLEEALATYREASARYEQQPAALTAQVQIANILLRLGRLTEAARAIERARWLLRNVPEENFGAAVDGADRSYWQHYLDTVAASPLFADLLSATP